MDDDAAFFTDHPDRQARIRKPRKEIAVAKKTRQTAVSEECEAEFRSLGPHKRERRRILIYRVPPTNPHYDPSAPQLMKIPFLLFADETVEDRDDVLLPIIDNIMTQALMRGTYMQ